MASKTISLTVDAYQRLRAAKRRPSESFTDVVLRAEWPERPITGRELLERGRRRGAILTERDLDAIEAAIGRDTPPADKWSPS